ncbi:hypothetical protein [Tsukamurella sp. NPDC003166]|uniref:hypothetical protein n=1 Tax=Tsukamurella sp. NPDC003166 TaxID=3154444 RepID=UPI0033BB3FCD
MIRLRVTSAAAALAAGTTLLLPATAFAAPNDTAPTPKPVPAAAKHAPKPAPGVRPAAAKPAAAKPAAKPVSKPAAAPQDPLTGFVCTVIQFIPGGLQTVQSTLQTVGTAEKELVAGARQIAPGPADAYKAFRAPIDQQVTALLTACAGPAK